MRATDPPAARAVRVETLWGAPGPCGCRVAVSSTTGSATLPELVTTPVTPSVLVGGSTETPGGTEAGSMRTPLVRRTRSWRTASEAEPPTVLTRVATGPAAHSWGLVTHTERGSRGRPGPWRSCRRTPA